MVQSNNVLNLLRTSTILKTIWRQNHMESWEQRPLEEDFLSFLRPHAEAAEDGAAEHEKRASRLWWELPGPGLPWRHLWAPDYSLPAAKITVFVVALKDACLPSAGPSQTWDSPCWSPDPILLSNPSWLLWGLHSQTSQVDGQVSPSQSTHGFQQPYYACRPNLLLQIHLSQYLKSIFSFGSSRRERLWLEPQNKTKNKNPDSPWSSLSPAPPLYPKTPQTCFCVKSTVQHIFLAYKYSCIKNVIWPNDKSVIPQLRKD